MSSLFHSLTVEGINDEYPVLLVTSMTTTLASTINKAYDCISSTQTFGLLLPKSTGDSIDNAATWTKSLTNFHKSPKTFICL